MGDANVCSNNLKNDVPRSRWAASTSPFDDVTIHLRRSGQSKDSATFSPSVCVCVRVVWFSYAFCVSVAVR